jgi:vitamin B12 transporter
MKRGLQHTAVFFLAAVLPIHPWGPGSAAGQERPIELEGIVVTANRLPRPLATLTTNVTVLEGQELREEGVTFLTDALREVPGLTVQESGSFGSVTSVFVRGGESDYVLVLVDGVQMNRPGGTFDFSSLTTENVERIEVVRGPSSALYGSDAVSGVIHVITRTGQGELRGSVAARAGSYGRREWRGQVSGGGEAASYGFSLSRISGQGILPFNNEHDRTGATGSVRLDFGPDGWARFSARYADRTYHFPTDGSGNVVDQNAFTYGDELSLSLDAAHSPTSRLEVRGLLTLHDNQSGTDDAPDGPADTLGFYAYTSLSDFRRAAGDVRANVQLGQGSVLTVGGEVEEESEQVTSETLSAFGPSNEWRRNRRWNRGLYAQLVAERGGWTADAAGRMEDNERFGSFFTYQVGTSYRLEGAGTRVRASVGRSVKEPTFYENFATGFARGNPALDPETAFGWEAGVEQDVLEGRLRLTATYFRQRFEDLIQYTAQAPEPGGPNFFNVARAESRGLEATATLGLGFLETTASYTHLDTEVLDAGFHEGPGATFVEGEPLLRRPAHQVSLSGASALTDRASTSLAVRWVGEREDRNFSAWPAEAVTLNSYLALDATLSVQVLEAGSDGPGIALLLRGENLLDQGYQEAYGFPAPGRGIYGGVRVGFGG